jgi:hypothetical protein
LIRGVVIFISIELNRLYHVGVVISGSGVVIGLRKHSFLGLFHKEPVSHVHIRGGIVHIDTGLHQELGVRVVLRNQDLGPGLRDDHLDAFSGLHFLNLVIGLLVILLGFFTLKAVLFSVDLVLFRLCDLRVVNFLQLVSGDIVVHSLTSLTSIRGVLLFQFLIFLLGFFLCALLLELFQNVGVLYIVDHGLFYFFLLLLGSGGRGDSIYSRSVVKLDALIVRDSVVLLGLVAFFESALDGLRLAVGLVFLSKFVLEALLLAKLAQNRLTLQLVDGQLSHGVVQGVHLVDLLFQVGDGFGLGQF